MLSVSSNVIFNIFNLSILMPSMALQRESNAPMSESPVKICTAFLALLTRPVAHKAFHPTESFKPCILAQWFLGAAFIPLAPKGSATFTLPGPTVVVHYMFLEFQPCDRQFWRRSPLVHHGLPPKVSYPPRSLHVSWIFIMILQPPQINHWNVQCQKQITIVNAVVWFAVYSNNWFHHI